MIAWEGEHERRVKACWVGEGRCEGERVWFGNSLDVSGFDEKGVMACWSLEACWF